MCINLNSPSFAVPGTKTSKLDEKCRYLIETNAQQLISYDNDGMSLFTCKITYNAGINNGLRTSEIAGERY